MKKIFVTFLIGTMLFSTTACTAKATSGTAAESASVVSDASAESVSDTSKISSTSTSDTSSASTSAISSESTTDQENDEDLVSGGWSTYQADELPQEAADALQKAAEKLDGAAYEPIRLLAEQIVAGTNYAILCRITPVVPDPVSSYAVVYVYADLDNNAEITDVYQFTDEAEEESEGGWTAVNDDEAVNNAQTALEKATAELTGAVYESTAVIASQIVAGTNYKILCKITPVVPDARASYNLVVVYEDLEGKAEILSVEELPY